jgi:LysM repeat protein
MPILAVLGIGALVGLAGYLGYHAIKHFFFHSGWDLSWKGAGASVAAGAVALPALLFGSGLLAAGAGLELTPLALGGGASAIGAITGAIEDPGQKAPKPVAPVASASVNVVKTPPVVAHVSTASVAHVSTLSIAHVSTATAPLVAVTPKEYTVVAGNTLTEIAAKLGVSLAALEKANPQIGNRPLPANSPYTSAWNLIRPGDEINIPPPAKSPGVTAALGKIGDPVPGNDQ